jgi:ketosteroid isomerase-like protein
LAVPATDAGGDTLLDALCDRKENGHVTALDERLLDQYHRALGELINGNPDLYKSMFSDREDVTLANPFGPAARGRAGVEERLDRAASNYSDGQLTGFEQIAKYETPELAYLVEVERYRAKVGGRQELAPVALRVTSIFRPEGATWKVVHRHADPITTERRAESVLQE